MDDLIDRRAALDAIEWTWAGKAAFDAIKELPSAQPEPRWIPVIEPPEYSGRFLCYYETEESGEVGHCIDFGSYDEDDGGYVSGVKYWMPLPDEPYERSEDGSQD